MAISATIATIIKTAFTKPTVAKAIGKYTARGILRKSGVFGIYGSFIKYKGVDMSRAKIFALMTKSVLKKNILRSLGPTNFIIDIFKDRSGIKYALKQFGWQKMTPMAIKKLWYLKQNYDSLLGKKNPFMKEAKKELWGKLRLRNKEHTYSWKLDQIEAIMNTQGVKKSFKKELLNDWFYFKVKSPCGSFNKHSYRWNPSTGKLFAYVVSADRYGHPHKGASPKEYWKNGVPISLIRKSINTSSYGRMVYWVDYKQRNKK